MAGNMIHLLRYLLLTVLFSQSVFAADGISVNHAWIKEAPPGVRVLAAYMTIDNQGSADIALTGVASEMFDKVEIHLTKTDNGVASMHKQEHISIPAGSSFSFSPGSYHLMLFNPAISMQRDAEIPLDLTFSNGQTLRVHAVVRRGDDHVHSH